MRKVINGNGQDSTAAVRAWLQANNKLWLRNLYLIGEPEDPRALWLTDHEAPLLWAFWGTFRPANIRRGPVASKIGLDVGQFEISWSPSPSAFGFSTHAASPYELARIGYYDNWPVRVWTLYMPTPGDADTFGASELFGGRISRALVERGEIRFTVTSFLDIINQHVPTNVIELTNTKAGYRAATPPPGLTEIPQFEVVAGSGVKTVAGRATFPTPDQLFANGAFNFGYLVFNHGGTLDGIWAAVQSSFQTTSGYNGFHLFAELPWSPTPGLDTFYVSAVAPLNQQDGDYNGFPFVPAPEEAV